MVVLSQSKDQTILNLTIACDEKGKGTVQVYDLMSNFITEMEYDKNYRVFTGSFTLNVSTGIYFFRINLNNQTLQYQKLIIVK